MRVGVRVRVRARVRIGRVRPALGHAIMARCSPRPFLRPRGVMNGGGRLWAGLREDKRAAARLVRDRLRLRLRLRVRVRARVRVRVRVRVWVRVRVRVRVRVS